MPFRLRILAVALVSAAMLTGSSCADNRAAPVVDCGTKISVSRTIEMSAGAPTLFDQLASGEVILTFDDGPAGKSTRAVLDTLDAHCTKATFFLQGDKVKKRRKLAAEIEARGHGIGSHSFDHANLAELPLADAIANVTRGHDTVNAAVTMPAALFRYPFLAKTQRLDAAIADLGLIEVGVDVDAQDWTGNTPDERVALVMAGLNEKGRKGVILLHDPFPKSAETADLLLTSLKEQGYAIVALR